MMMFMLQMTQAAITLPLTDPVLKFLLILVIILAAPLLLNKLRIQFVMNISHVLHFGIFINLCIRI